MREFHGILLRNGLVPLEILERFVDEWGKEKRSQQAPRLICFGATSSVP